ncbi:MAG: hypothetical protein EBW84_07105 [Betaproteobacteria bacterium]|nr:hypothetical protein [Betaproteobacteria bacterium]
MPGAGAALTTVLKDFALPVDGSGPWTQLIGYAGGPEEAGKLWTLLLQSSERPEVKVKGLEALLEAAARGVRPVGDLKGLSEFVLSKESRVARPALGSSVPEP